MKIKEAIILAGGLGTRLRESVPGLPKCLAPVAGRPFLFYVINHLRMRGIERFIFSLGYQHELIEEWLAQQFSRLNYKCVIEKEPLGTGGAIRLASQEATNTHVLATNGDTLFDIDIDQLFAVHLKTNATCTLALKSMRNFDRYGAVSINNEHAITGFHEKQFLPEGLINGGIYILNKERFDGYDFPEKFSFEKDFLEKQSTGLAGQAQDVYFIDIGIPEDYNKAQQDLKPAPIDLKAIDKSWTLFLDRDGVINVDKPGSYIFNAGEFIFMDGLPAAFKQLSGKFGRIIVATNQRGVSRNLMTEKDLAGIHQKMIDGVKAAGSAIDAIYYCTAINNDHPDRKPNPGMAVKAKADFEAIDFKRSIMVGNNISDMQMGRNAGMYTIFVKTTIPGMQVPHPDIDLIYDSLADFAKALES